MNRSDRQLDEAVDELRQRMQDEDVEQYLDWLVELQERREEAEVHTYQLAELGRALHECREELARLRRAAMPSSDANIHIRVEISQDTRRWMAARRVSATTMEAFGRVPIVPEEARRAAEEAAIGFLEEALR